MLTGNEKRKCPEDAHDLQETPTKRQKPEADIEKKEEKTLSATNEKKQQASQNSGQLQTQPSSHLLQNTDETALNKLITEANDVYEYAEDGKGDFKREQKVIDGLKDEVKKTDRSSTEYAKIYIALSQIYEYRYGQLIRGEYRVHIENEKKLQEESKVLCYQYLLEAEKYLTRVAQESHGQLDHSLYERFLDTRFLFYDSLYKYEDTNFRKQTVQIARVAVGAFPNSFYFLQLLADVLAYENPYKADIRNESEFKEAKYYYQAALQIDPFDKHVRDGLVEVDKRIAEFEAQQRDGLETSLAPSTLSINPYSFMASSTSSSSCTNYISVRSPSFTSSTVPSE